MFKPRVILSDLDGTLIDSVPDLTYAIDSMLTQLGIETRGIAKVRKWVGNGAQNLVKRALINDFHGEPPPHLFAQAMPLFLSEYQKFNGQHSTLYNGVQESLNWLRTHTYPLACITNKPTRFTHDLLKQLQIHHCFDLILSGDTLPRQKPDPLPLLHAADTFQVKPEELLFIGDSINDVQAARAAGCPIVCVSYGYNHGEDIRTAHPDAVIDSFTELTHLITPT